MAAENADRAAASAADVIFGRLASQIGDKNASAARLTASVFPLYGLARSRMILTRCDAKRRNSMLARLRNSKMPGLEYDRLADFWKNAYFPPP